jgi:hypothetical protein
MKFFKITVFIFAVLCLSSLSSAAINGDLPAPTPLKATATNDGLDLSWTPPASTPVEGYNLYIKRPGAVDFKLATSQPMAETSVHLKRLFAGREYIFAVTAVGMNGEESPRAQLKVIIKNAGFAPPLGFKAEILCNGIRLKWDRCEPASVSGFNLYLADEAGRPVRKLSAEPLTENQVTLTKLKVGKTYRFLLTALSNDGRESPPAPVLEVQNTGGENPDGSWFLGLAGGADLPVQNWQSAYTLGQGGRITLGYAFNTNLAVELDLEGFCFSGSNYSGAISDIELLALPSLRYRFLAQGVSPYLLAGAGPNIEILSASPGQVILENVDAAAGLGVEIPLSGRAFVFAEAKFNFLFFPGVSAQDVPVWAGARFGL